MQVIGTQHMQIVVYDDLVVWVPMVILEKNLQTLGKFRSTMDFQVRYFDAFYIPVENKLS